MNAKKKMKRFVAVSALLCAFNAAGAGGALLSGDDGAVLEAVGKLNERLGLVEKAKERRRGSFVPYWVVETLLEKPLERLRSAVEEAETLDEGVVREAEEILERAEGEMFVPSFREGDRV